MVKFIILEMEKQNYIMVVGVGVAVVMEVVLVERVVVVMELIQKKTKQEKVNQQLEILVVEEVEVVML